MQYREFGKDRRKVSVLGFGCMRLPTVDGKPNSEVDEKEALRIIRHGIDAGINYVDGAKVYHNGTCEAVMGRALMNGYREKVLVATKLPTWDVKTRRDADRIFDEQRRDLRTDKIDVYLIHNIQRNFWETCQKNDLAEWALKKKEKGEIGYVGFSFHDSYDFFVEVLDWCDDWDFCQLQYNYTGEQVQAGTKGIEYAVSRGLSVVVMEPLLGGALAAPSGKMGKMFHSLVGKTHHPVDLALRWLWNKPEISVVLSGMSSIDQVSQNLQIADRGKVGSLSDDESAFISELQKIYDKSMPIRCTRCRYCMPCPHGVDIPLNFEYFNNFSAVKEMEKDPRLNVLLYGSMPKDHQAGNCRECGQCEGNCPQQLPISQLMKNVHSTLG